MSGLSDGRVLALRLTAQGFGYVIFEAPRAPIDWGVGNSQAGAVTLRSFSKLVARYKPEVLVLEACEEGGARRSERIRRLYRALESMARLESIEIFRFSSRELRNCFSRFGGHTKYERAKAICGRIDAFSFRLPQPRRCWETESRWMSLFDAAALGLTFFDATGHEI